MEQDFSVSSFHRTTSNAFITPAQYKLLETAPIESDRRVLEKIRVFLGGEETSGTTQASASSIVDPFVATLNKQPLLLRQCHDYLWYTVLDRFGLSGSEVGRRPPKSIPRRAMIQLDNTLRRMRDAKDPTPVKTTEALEVQAAWHLRKIKDTKDKKMWIRSILAMRSVRLPELIAAQVANMLRDLVEPGADRVWSVLLENEHMLWTGTQRSIELYPTQVKLLRELETTDALLVQLATPPCTGKTVMAAATTMALGQTTLIFCCVSPGVYLHVARLLYYIGVYPTFVFGNRRVEPNFKISRVTWDPTVMGVTCKQYLQKTIPAARAFIVDLNLCRWFMEQVADDKDALLFLDEPTMGADGTEAFAHVPDLIAGILKSPKLPRRVVLSSATLPTSTDLVPLVQPWRNKYTRGRVVRIDDAILTSSISIVSMETGEVVLPHSTCETAEELAALVERFQRDVVVLKAYSGLAVARMRAAYEHVYGSAPSFKECGIDWYDMSLLGIREYALQLLRRVVLDFRPEFGGWKGPSDFPALAPETLAMGFSPHVPGQTLIVSNHTENLAQRIVEPLIAARKLRHLENALEQEKHVKQSVVQQAVKIKDPEERRIYLQDQVHQPVVRFVPDDLIIHTTSHLQRHGGQDALAKFPKEFIRRPPPASVVRHVLNTSSEEWLKHSFLAGVMYTDVRLHTQTTSALVGLMESSLLEAIPVAVVDRSFSYGINVPASNVVILEESAEDMSHNSIVQFINRVARMSGTHGGKAFLCKTALRKLLMPDDGAEARVLQQAMCRA